MLTCITEFFLSHKSYAARAKFLRENFSELNARTAGKDQIRRLYDILHNISEPPLCRTCGKIQTKFDTFETGYKRYCSHKCSLANHDTTKKRQSTNIVRYGGLSPLSDNAIQNKRKMTMIDRYGVEHALQNEALLAKSLAKHKSHSALENKAAIEKRILSISEKYGDAGIWGDPAVVQKRKDTNQKKYGVDYAMQNKEVCNKSIATRIKRGGNSTSKNSSKEATEFIREYIKDKGYSLTQVAYSDKELGLYEWGAFFAGKWNMFDLTVFEDGFRGDVNHILEVVEYQGPFHYSAADVAERGSLPATPWKSCKMTIKESFDNDTAKHNFLKERNIRFTAITPIKYQKL